MSTSKDFDRIGSVSVPVSLAVSLAIVVIAGTIAFAVATAELREALKFGLALLAGAAAVYAAYFARVTLNQTVIRNRQQRSFELIDQLSEVDYVRVRRFIHDEIQSHVYDGAREKDRPKEIQAKIDGDIDLHDSVHQFLGFLESMSQQIQRNFVDEAILYEHCYYMVNNAFTNLESYISQSRKTDGAEELYIQVERLHNCWKDGDSMQSPSDKIDRLTNESC